MTDIRTLRVQGKLLKALKLFRAKMIDIENFADALRSTECLLEKYCDNSFPYEQQFLNTTVNLLDAIRSEVYLHMYNFKYDNEDVTPELWNSSNKWITEKFNDDINDLEKLIIRGSEGGAPVSNEERTEWWKMQKQREREEFYRLNGYYEDDEQ